MPLCMILSIKVLTSCAIGASCFCLSRFRKELEHCEDLKHVGGNDYNEMRHAQPKFRLRLESKVDGRRHQSTVIHTVAAVWWSSSPRASFFTASERRHRATPDLNGLSDLIFP